MRQFVVSLFDIVEGSLADAGTAELGWRDCVLCGQCTHPLSTLTMSTPVAPDNGVKLRGSVASRKATLRVHTLYDNEGKVSISTKSFRTLLVKIRGDP